MTRDDSLVTLKVVGLETFSWNNLLTSLVATSSQKYNSKEMIITIEDSELEIAATALTAALSEQIIVFSYRLHICLRYFKINIRECF